ncbi:(Fe-S)-binding protein [Candidatus Pacearchaeota archaeon]|nr:(Fe-S)-binding protein [Candidatus Pacearchaeota archaeon]
MGIIDFLGKLGKNTLYYPGCLTKYVLKSEMENYKKILNKIGVSYITIPEEICCNSPVANAGYESEAIKLARKNLELFKKYDVKKIVTNCPACFNNFNKEYKKTLPDWDIEVEHIIITILNYLRKKRISNPKRERAVYHDPCHLGRYSNMYDEPRELLTRLGYEIVELPNNKENSLCCGGGAGLKTNDPELANKIAKERIRQAKLLGVDKIITPCPLCYSNMKENSGIEIEEFSHAIAEKLGLNPEKTSLEFSSEQEACS